MRQPTHKPFDGFLIRQYPATGRMMNGNIRQWFQDEMLFAVPALFPPATTDCLFFPNRERRRLARVFLSAGMYSLPFRGGCSPAIGTMRDFSHAAFSPEEIGIMATALESAVAALPDPVHAAYVQIIAESILRTAEAGERDLPCSNVSR